MKRKIALLTLLMILMMDVDALAMDGVLTKSFYVPVVKGEYVEPELFSSDEPPFIGDEEIVDEDEPEGAIEEVIEGTEEEPVTPMNVYVIVSKPIQIELPDEDPSSTENGVIVVDETETETEVEIEEIEAESQ